MDKPDFEMMWDILKNRNRSSSFLYGVTTTGIYCRPGCSSRLPLKNNVRYFKNPEEAENAGYRACKRCRPARENQNADLFEKIVFICRVIENHSDYLSLEDLAGRINYSPWHFQKVFKRITGISPGDYLSIIRKDRFRDQLKSSTSVTDAIFNAGFGSASRVYEKSGDWLAMKPSEFRLGAPGQKIHYGISSCSLGLVLVAATGRGICSIDLGDNEEGLTEELTRRFHVAELIRAGEDFDSLLDKVVLLVDHPSDAPILPLDIQGTLFQERVWKTLKNIPAGETRTYSQIAVELGSPRSVRAVANACGANKLAVAVPCHRVVRKDGNPGGYHWGIQRKTRLLQEEREFNK